MDCSSAPASGDDPPPLRILFVTSECGPWVKTGGLGDVSSALPAALSRRGHDVRVLMPAYANLAEPLEQVEAEVAVPARPPWPAARLYRAAAPSFELWLLDCPELFARPGGPYLDETGKDFADNARRFGFLSRVAADLCAGGSPWSSWHPDVLHANDWPTALAPAYAGELPAPRPASVFTIHNLSFQGLFDAGHARELDLPSSWLTVDGVLHWDQICMLKGGVRYADAITTVSPTYAAEIQTWEHGCGMDGMLRLRSAALQGILNGIDTAVWNPATDRLIPSPYVAGQWRAKARNKAALQAATGLEPDAAAMLFANVGRLTAQKGIDLVLENVEWLVARGGQLLILGHGEQELEERIAAATATHPGRVGCRIGFDETLAHLIEAGADAFLMPSRFEPCGLNQMYSLVYGTPPVVHGTGGLADTVQDADADPEGTGFVMATASDEALRDAIERAMRAYANKRRWRQLQRRGMRLAFSWDDSAARYEGVYRHAMQRSLPALAAATA